MATERTDRASWENWPGITCPRQGKCLSNNAADHVHYHFISTHFYIIVKCLFLALAQD